MFKDTNGASRISDHKTQEE